MMTHAGHDAFTVVLHGGPGETGPLYTRLLATDPVGPHGGALLLTAEVYRDVGDAGPVFPIYRSADGRQWELVAEVADTAYGVGNRYQPVLYELPAPFAGLPAGTILLAGSSIPSDMSSTTLVVYSSGDGGRSWEYRSTVDSGGPAEYDPSPSATTTAVWEPCLELIGDHLVCFYADERRKSDGMLQVIVHRTTNDLVSWSEPHLDFGVADRFTRPGMFVTTGLMPDGMHRGVLEIVGPREVPIRMVGSTDGLDWGAPDDIGELLVASDGTMLSGTPNIHWRKEPSGTVTVLATGRHSLDADGRETNRALVNLSGGSGTWHSFELPVAAERRLDADSSGYSQSLLWNAAGELVQATTVRNDFDSHDIVVAVCAEPLWRHRAPASVSMDTETPREIA
ncbi:hypothetical protein HF576_05120 [Microbacterium sp. CFH 90308]|uniref:Exo-alpha-sialidase n=1 Tax=Microbacterium salsuginis TaxID=2722803 RepID=A0ABX1K882_9MICO|nr:hypothetical protein [Microbacterium sp. CFH 90308]NLP83219.1 hypothetical protein [Microbacterium sp. CFH 90308]